MTVKEQMVSKAMAMLKCTGAQYYIRTEEGREFQSDYPQTAPSTFNIDELPDSLARAIAKPHRKARSRGNTAYFIRLGPQKKTSLEVSQVIDIPPLPGDTVDRLANNLSAFCHRYWGEGAATTRRDQKKGIVELMRNK